MLFVHKCSCGAGTAELHDPSGAVEFVCQECDKRVWLSELVERAAFSLVTESPRGI